MFETHFILCRPECEEAMRTAGDQPQRLLLRTLSGKCGEPAFDEADRRAAFAASDVWASAPDSSVATGRCSDQPKAGGTVDEGHGHRGHLSQAGHKPGSAGTRDLPVFIEEQVHYGSRPGMVRGHHLHPHEARVHVSDGGDGLVEPVRAGVGVEQHAGGGVLRAGMADGAGPGKSTAAHLQHGPGSAVHLRRLCRGGGASRGAGEHGRSRAVDGQPFYRTAVAEPQV